MRKNKIFIAVMIAGILPFLLATPGLSYSLLLPFAACTPPLPYLATPDHYGGAACVQMILNSCPDTTERGYHDIDDIYNSIVLHNTEPSQWFSDPNGINGALMDPVFSPCGNWVDYSNADKAYVLGKMLYYMRTQSYLTPVSITDGEHWVTVIGYQTDIEPPHSGTVTLQNVIFYDPNPGNQSLQFVSGTIWLNSSDYWGVPHNKPGSNWQNKYIAVIEPPPVNIKVIVPDWIVRGRILPIDRIKQYCISWLKKIREEEFIKGPFDILQKDIGIEEPILVEADKYSYYLLPFQDRRLAAIFNAYNGSFEEFSFFKEPREMILSRKEALKELDVFLRESKTKVSRIEKTELKYIHEAAAAGRFSPVWNVQAVVLDPKKKEQKINIFLDLEGRVVKKKTVGKKGKS
ncbi:MAG: hypothetical protein JXB26_06910 [Candidatus Aminicenantes bacterium]|nr:hypothetical protein [Candidatus Aminicenantes bacterium]